LGQEQNVSTDEMKDFLHDSLRRSRDAILWKLEGLSAYDARRPMTSTGTNLLGLVKHLTYGQAWYFGRCFDRPFGEPLTDWDDGAEPNADMYAKADEPREFILSRYQRACAHADSTIGELDLDAVGFVPWWGDSGEHASLGRLLVHSATENSRHLGHADIVRELVDGRVGARADHSNLPEIEGDYWTAYCSRLEQIAREASSG
jgi:Protein of unknown function (DUF664)